MTLNQRSIDGELFVDRKPRCDRLLHNARKELLRESVHSESFAIMREGRRHEDLVVWRHVEKPAKEKVGLRSTA